MSHLCIFLFKTSNRCIYLPNIQLFFSILKHYTKGNLCSLTYVIRASALSKITKKQSTMIPMPNQEGNCFNQSTLNNQKQILRVLLYHIQCAVSFNNSCSITLRTRKGCLYGVSVLILIKALPVSQIRLTDVTIIQPGKSSEVTCQQTFQCHTL